MLTWRLQSFHSVNATKLHQYYFLGCFVSSFSHGKCILSLFQFFRFKIRMFCPGPILNSNRINCKPVVTRVWPFYYSLPKEIAPFAQQVLEITVQTTNEALYCYKGGLANSNQRRQIIHRFLGTSGKTVRSPTHFQESVPLKFQLVLAVLLFSPSAILWFIEWKNPEKGF